MCSWWTTNVFEKCIGWSCWDHWWELHNWLLHNDLQHHSTNFGSYMVERYHIKFQIMYFQIYILRVLIQFITSLCKVIRLTHIQVGSLCHLYLEIPPVCSPRVTTWCIPPCAGQTIFWHLASGWLNPGLWPTK